MLENIYQNGKNEVEFKKIITRRKENKEKIFFSIFSELENI